MLGDDVVQIYVNKTGSSAYGPRPFLQLRGFKRVHVGASATVHVSIPVKVSNLMAWDPATSSWILEPGTYNIMAGTSAEDIVLTRTITVL